MRTLLLASLVVAFESYGILEAYACKSLVCLEPALWMLIGLIAGLGAGALIQCGRCAKPPLNLAMLGLGYTLLVGLVAFLVGLLPLVLASLALLIVFAFYGKGGLCEVSLVTLSLAAYLVFISIIEGLQLTASVPVYILLGVLIATFMCENFIEASKLGRRSVVANMLGVLLVAIAGFFAAYAFQPYSLGLAAANISGECMGIASHCVRVGSMQLPVAAWGYTLIYVVQLAVTGVFLALPSKVKS